MLLFYPYCHFCGHQMAEAIMHLMCNFGNMGVSKETLRSQTQWANLVYQYKTLCFMISISLNKNTAKRNMSSAVCASSMYSRLCMKMSSFLFVRACAMPYTLYLSCGILLSFPVKHQLWSGCRGGRSSKKTSGKFLRGGYGGDVFEGQVDF